MQAFLRSSLDARRATATFYNEVKVIMCEGSLGRVLTVDNCEDTANSLTRLLQLWGFESVACYDGATALKSAAFFAPHVVLLDLVYPVMDGFEIARRLREQPRSHSAVLVAITGWHGEGMRRRARDAGVDHYLLKPTDCDYLKDLLSRLAPSPKNMQPGSPPVLRPASQGPDFTEAENVPPPVLRSGAVSGSATAEPRERSSFERRNHECHE